MNRQLLCRGALLLLAAPAALLASSCISGRIFFVRGCLAERPDTCEVSADPNSPALSQGVFDPGFQNDYACPLLVGNTSEPSIEVTEAEVRLLREDGSSLPTSAADSSPRVFRVPVSGFVETGTVAVPGLGITRLRLLDVAAADGALAEKGPDVVVLAAVVLHGKTLDGEEVSSEEWRFPIRVVAHQALCDTIPCIPGTDLGGYPPDNCHPGINDKTDCRQGCGCAVGTGDCAPLACIAAASGSTKGICLPCRVGESDCASPATCVPYPSNGSSQGLCQ